MSNRSAMAALLVEHLVGLQAPRRVLVQLWLLLGLCSAAAWLAIRFGWRPSSAAGTMGTWAAAYIATKLTQPIRIGATLLLTPIVARVLHKLGLLKSEKATPAPETTVKAEPPESPTPGGA